MCVKEFLGYNCGHCAIPYLRQCPLTASNTNFPPCKYPAERPIFTNENCHPCSRVLWNQKVLKEEEEHRVKHQNGECECPVIFDAEERERRRTRPAKKGKGKGKEIGFGGRSAGSVHGDESMEMVRGGGPVHTPVRERAGHYGGYERDEPAGPQYPPRGGADYYRSPVSSKADKKPDINHQQQQQQGWGNEHAVGGSGFDYVGYYVAGQGRKDMHQVEQGMGFPADGFVPQNALWSGQMQLDQPGAGMKWYPEQNRDLPVLPPFPTGPPQQVLPVYAPPPPPPAAPVHATNYAARKVWQKALSEPTDLFVQQYSPPGSFSVVAEPADVIPAPEPVVVSSDMVNSMS